MINSITTRGMYIKNAKLFLVDQILIARVTLDSLAASSSPNSDDAWRTLVDDSSGMV